MARVYVPEFNGYVPRHILESLHRYVDHGIRTGGFVEAVLANDLWRALSVADPDSMRALKEIVWCVTSFVPANACGSYENVEDWLSRKDHSNHQTSHRIRELIGIQ